MFLRKRYRVFRRKGPALGQVINGMSERRLREIHTTLQVGVHPLLGSKYNEDTATYTWYRLVDADPLPQYIEISFMDAYKLYLLGKL